MSTGSEPRVERKLIDAEDGIIQVLSPLEVAHALWNPGLEDKVFVASIVQGQEGGHSLLATMPISSELLDSFLGHIRSDKTQTVEVKVVGSAAGTGLVSRLLRQLTGVSVKTVEVKPGECECFWYADSGLLKVRNEQKKRRVLVVDDSSTMRTLLTRLINAEPDLEVVGAAERPSQVEDMILALRPNVITLDIHMPEMDGVTLLEKLLARYPIPAVMVSALSREEGDFVLRALEVGAVDYVQKPSLSEMEVMGPDLIEKIRGASYAKVNRRLQEAAEERLMLETAELDLSMVVAMGASTGGTEALRRVLVRLPERIPPIVITQHIPKVFSKAFAMRLNQLCPFEVKEAEDGDVLRAGRVLIAPGGLQMSVEHSKHDGLFRARVTDAPLVNGHKPSVDVLFRSVATAVGRKAVGILLTGMGSDGAKGLFQMKQSGARTIVQDKETSVVFGMPGEAVKIGAADQVLAIQEISGALLKWLIGQKNL